ncbi:MAG: thioredoxin family protein [Bacteroidota bacterium]
MKRFPGSFLTITLLLFVATTSVSQFDPPAEAAEIEWLSWSEAIEKMKDEPRKILVDVYTEWCGYCKQMDRNVFPDAIVSAYIRDHFYAVKLDAEAQEPLVYDNHTFRWLKDQGRNGVHELAFALLDGSLRYPSMVYMDETQKRISISPGFKNPQNLMNELKFINENHYKQMSWEEYKNR